MFDQFRELLSTIMNTGQHGDALRLALKLAIGALIFYYGYMFIFKRKSRKQSTSPKSRTATAEPTYEEPVEEPVEEPSIDGTIDVDKMIVHALKYHETLDFKERQLKTSTGHNASNVYDRINSLIRNSNRIADELKRNESKLNKGTSGANTAGFEVSMSNYDVKINLIGWTVNMNLNQLQSLSSVNDLKGKIDNGLILGHDAFRTY